MSAYILDPQQVAQLGAFVEEHGRNQKLFVYMPNRAQYADNYRSGQQIAEALMRENVRSVNYRYNERSRSPKVDVDAVPRAPKLPEMRELLGRWKYNACERKDFERSEGYRTYVCLLELLADVAAKEAA